MRPLIKLSLKLALVAGLLTWLVTNGKLDFHQLEAYLDPGICISMLCLWGIGFLGLGTLRWYWLLRGLDLDVEFSRTLRLQLIGFFFNTALPGAVGGDIVKAVYVIRDQNAQSKTPALLTVLLDRIIGLGALFILAGAAIALNPGFFASGALASLALFVAVGLLGYVVAFGLVMVPFRGGDPIAKFLQRRWPGFELILKIYTAMRAYRHRPGVLFSALAISIVVQSGSLAFAFMLTQKLTGATPPLAVFGTIFPIGIMTTALPLAPGGLGVGHVAFDKLFAMVGLSGGANVFNVMVLGQLFLNLFGFIPYLLHRQRLMDLATTPGVQGLGK